MKENQNAKKILTILADIFICLLSALLVSGSLYYFSNYNQFAPGGVTGFASIIGSFLHKFGIGEDVTMNMSILMFVFNLPIFLLVALFSSRKTGLMLIVYLLFQSGLLMLFKHLNLPYYAAFSAAGEGYQE